MSDPGPGEHGEMVAAEYALGLLEGGEQHAAERRMTHEPGFAAAVEAWQARLAPLGEARPAQPSAHLWPRILQAIGLDNVVELRLRRSLVRWRAATAAAACVAAALALGLVWPRAPASPGPVMSAKLSGDHGPAVFVATYDSASKRIVLTPVSITAAPDRSPELWLIPAGGKPVSLGIAEFKHAVQLRPQVGLGGAGAVLAISIEPRGGSPTGQPTGPVVATGKMQLI